MTRTKKFLIAAAAMLAITGTSMLLAPRTVTAQAAPAAPKLPGIRTVNMVKVFNSLLQKTDSDNELRDLGSKLEKELTDQKNELDALQKELGNWTVGGPEYRAVEEKILRGAAAMEGQKAFSEQRMQMESRLKTLQIYLKLKKGVEDYAKENGIALVLMIDEPNLTDSRSQQELQSKIGMRKVMYADESLDISKPIIEKLNAEWTTNRGRPATMPGVH